VSLDLSCLPCKYTLGSVIVPVVPRNVFRDLCYLGAALRRLELLFGAVDPNRQFQLIELKIFPFHPNLPPVNGHLTKLGSNHGKGVFPIPSSPLTTTISWCWFS
jgi:hypothetical protein